MKGLIIPTLAVAAVYFVVTTYLMNSRLVVDTIMGNYPLVYKTSLLVGLVTGMWSVMGTVGLAILTATSLLTGANLAILIPRVTQMSRLGGIHLVAGGSSLLGLVSSGCAACGLPIISLLGLSGSLFYLPFRGLELSYLSLILLMISLVFLVKSNRADRSCTVIEK